MTFESILRDPKLVGVDEEGNAVFRDDLARLRREGKARPPIMGGADGIYYRDLRQPFVTADQTGVTLLTTQLQLWAVGVTSPTILPANYWTIGKTVKLTANLKWTCVANANAITLGMCYGSAAAPACIVLSTGIVPVSSTTVFDVFMEGYATCRSVGSAGTLSMWGIAFVPVGMSVNGPATFPSAGVTVVSTIDTTVGTNALSFTAARATTAGDTVVTTSLLMEALN
jgi:hypothetical protein